MQRLLTQSATEEAKERRQSIGGARRDRHRQRTEVPYPRQAPGSWQPSPGTQRRRNADEGIVYTDATLSMATARGSGVCASCGPLFDGEMRVVKFIVSIDE